MRAAGILFFVSWILCGCCIDGMLDDWRVGIVAAVTLIIITGCALALDRGRAEIEKVR